jgi:hypothetical protein
MSFRDGTEGSKRYSMWKVRRLDASRLGYKEQDGWWCHLLKCAAESTFCFWKCGK